jgi:hypothetical protein
VLYLLGGDTQPELARQAGYRKKDVSEAVIRILDQLPEVVLAGERFADYIVALRDADERRRARAPRSLTPSR